jgi:hypothetical protein
MIFLLLGDLRPISGRIYRRNVRLRKRLSGALRGEPTASQPAAILEFRVNSKYLVISNSYGARAGRLLAVQTDSDNSDQLPEGGGHANEDRFSDHAKAAKEAPPKIGISYEQP